MTPGGFGKRRFFLLLAPSPWLSSLFPKLADYEPEDECEDEIPKLHRQLVASQKQPTPIAATAQLPIKPR